MDILRALKDLEAGVFLGIYLIRLTCEFILWHLVYAMQFILWHLVFSMLCVSLKVTLRIHKFTLWIADMLEWVQVANVSVWRGYMLTWF